MARLQILELPMTHIGEATETPFVLVIDQCHLESLDAHSAVDEYWQRVKEQVGARAVIVTNETIEIP